MAVSVQKMTLVEYLAWENAQDARHEFWRGEVFAMVGARRVEVFRRNERGNFELIDQTGAAELALECLGLRLPMDEVFDGVGEAAA